MRRGATRTAKERERPYDMRRGSYNKERSYQTRQGEELPDQMKRGSYQSRWGEGATRPDKEEREHTRWEEGATWPVKEELPDQSRGYNHKISMLWDQIYCACTCMHIHVLIMWAFHGGMYGIPIIHICLVTLMSWLLIIIAYILNKSYIIVSRQ